MKPKHAILLLLFAFALSSGAFESSWGIKIGEPQPSSKALRVSLLRVFSAPEIYNGKRIVTEGILCAGEREYFLFIYTEDFVRFRLDNAFQLFFSIPKSAPVGWRAALHGKRVQIEGTIKTPNKGAAFATGGGVFENITLVYEIKDSYPPPLPKE